MSVSVRIDTHQIRGWTNRLRLASAKIGGRQLMDELAGLVESQTKRRIADEKTGPDGRPWKPWSKEYAKTRKGHHSLLVSTSALRDDIAGEADGPRSFSVFTVREYGGAMHDQRPYLGLSDANAKELEQVTLDIIAGKL